MCNITSIVFLTTTGMRGSEEFGPVSELAKLRDGILGQTPSLP